jgi:hypothetical protein
VWVIGRRRVPAPPERIRPFKPSIAGKATSRIAQ